MDTKAKNIRFDEELQIEAYQFTGLAQKFPSHFHDYYVVGLIEVGVRRLTVNNQGYQIGPGDLLTFNPMDNHTCEQTDSGSLSYRCLNIKQDIMSVAAREIFGSKGSPLFCQPVQYRTDLAPIYRQLHDSLMGGSAGMEKEELFLLFIQQLLAGHALTYNTTPPQTRKEIEDVCTYLEAHYTEQISLDMLEGIAALNKYTLVRTFTRWKGITPYRYLEAVRIGEAKKLLERGVEPAEVAQRTGFSDQSHFTSYFNKLIGLTPGQYQSIFSEGLE